MSSWRVRDAAMTEWLDAEQLDRAALDRNLRDIRRINAVLGWTAFTTRAVISTLRSQPRHAWTLLDVASGSADIPLAIARAAQRARLDLRITATDRSAQIVSIACEQTATMPSITVEQQDALALPYADASFDLALCTLALHHFAPEEAQALLWSMARVGRRVLVYDVVRSPLAYAGVIALTRLGRMHPMTCHDGPASVRRAYSAAEALALATAAGLRNPHVRVDFPYRLILTADGMGAPVGAAEHDAPAAERGSHAL